MADHDFIKTMRRGLDIGENENFLEAVAPKFVLVDPADRKRDLAQINDALQDPADLREKSQLGTVARRLADLDARLRRAGR